MIYFIIIITFFLTGCSIDQHKYNSNYIYYIATPKVFEDPRVESSYVIIKGKGIFKGKDSSSLLLVANFLKNKMIADNNFDEKSIIIGTSNLSKEHIFEEANIKQADILIYPEIIKWLCKSETDCLDYSNNNIILNIIIYSRENDGNYYQVNNIQLNDINCINTILMIT